MRKIGIGLDFGTSNTTAAIFDGDDISYIRLDALTEKGIIMPTALYLDREFSPVVGSGALRQCLEDNTGRKIVLTDKEVGCVTVHMGEMDRDYFIERDRTFTTVVSGKIDAELPGRLFRSMKSYLGDKGDIRFDVFGRKFKLEAILTIILRHIFQQIGESATEAEYELYVGRPVHYRGTSSDPGYTALERMKNTCANAGRQDISFMMEPEAAALSYLHSHKSSGRENILVFDFGGGTLDLCIMKREGEEYELAGVSGIPRAGDNIDKMIFHSKISPLLGAGLGQSCDFHFSEFEENLLNWQSTYLLNQSSYMEKINALIKRGGEEAETGRRLKRLIRSNGSFQLMEMIEQAKIELSRQEETVISMEEIDLSVAITRKEFEEILLPVFDDINSAVEQVLSVTEMSAGEVDRIVCTGGSSKIPAVRRHIQRTLGKEPEEWDSFRGIAAGLAVAAFNKTRIRCS